MGRHYEQLSLRERSEINLLRNAGWSLRAIGAHLGRAASTIGRELARNSRVTKRWPGGYEPERADHLAQRRRRWDARFRLARQPDLAAYVRQRLAMGLSPEQIAGRLALTQARTVISHESIYRFVYHCSAKGDPSWHRLLPLAKHRRGRLGKRGGSPVDRIQRRVPLAMRSSEANQRRQVGHWEADLMLFKTYGQAVLVLQERTSRFLFLARPPGKAAAPVADHLLAFLKPLTPDLRRSVTFDNGTEFAFHHHLTDKIGVATFFCDPHAPWQKGGIENTARRLRRHLPRKTDLNALPSKAITAIAKAYNDTPRKCLGYRTPAEAFQMARLQLLHFNREFSSSLSRG